MVEAMRPAQVFHHFRAAQFLTVTVFCHFFGDEGGLATPMTTQILPPRKRRPFRNTRRRWASKKLGGPRASRAGGELGGGEVGGGEVPGTQNSGAATAVGTFMVVLDVSAPALVARIQSVARLIGVPVVQADQHQVRSQDLLISDGASTAESFGERVDGGPKIMVAFGASNRAEAAGSLERASPPGLITLPGEEDLLLLALSAWHQPKSPESGAHLVGTWTGGAAGAARNLARHLGAVFIDASGRRSVWQPPQGALTWRSLRKQGLGLDAGLAESLPSRGGVPVLTVRDEAPIQATDPYLQRLVDAVNLPTVVYCGRDIDGMVDLAASQMRSGNQPSGSLLGAGSQTHAAALARHLSVLEDRSGGVRANIVSLTKPGPLFWSVTKSYGQSAFKLPTLSRDTWWAKYAASLQRQVSERTCAA